LKPSNDHLVVTLEANSVTSSLNRKCSEVLHKRLVSVTGLIHWKHMNCHLDVHGSCNQFKKPKVCVYIYMEISYPGAIVMST